MKKKLQLIALFLCFGVLNGQQNLLSEQAEISVLTIGPGQSLNDAFGHSAFRVKDPIKGIDLVFNYGVYDFNTPNFYLKFAQGKLNYLIGLNYFEDFYNAYVSQNRSIKAQELNFSTSEKQKLFDFLILNTKPENRAYLYDFFYDNCATKIKDVTNLALTDNIRFNTPKDFQQKTFRTLIQNNLNKNSWGSLGIDIALGSVIDRIALPEEHMFLPENIYQFFSIATIKNDNIPLVKSSQVLFEQKNNLIVNHFFTSPFFILSLLSILILYFTYRDFKRKQRNKWLDFTLFGMTGCFGIVILLLWFATDHKGTHQNYNLLWAFALNIFVLKQVIKENFSQWFIKYLKFLIILMLLLTLHWLIGVQVFAISLLPLLIAIFIRYIYLVKFYNS